MRTRISTLPATPASSEMTTSLLFMPNRTRRASRVSDSYGETRSARSINNAGTNGEFATIPRKNSRDVIFSAEKNDGAPPSLRGVSGELPAVFGATCYLAIRRERRMSQVESLRVVRFHRVKNPMAENGIVRAVSRRKENPCKCSR